MCGRGPSILARTREKGAGFGGRSLFSPLSPLRPSLLTAWTTSLTDCWITPRLGASFSMSWNGEMRSGNEKRVREEERRLSLLFSCLFHLELEHVLRLVEDAQDGGFFLLEGEAALFGLMGREKGKGVSAHGLQSPHGPAPDDHPGQADQRARSGARRARASESTRGRARAPPCAPPRRGRPLPSRLRGEHTMVPGG